MRKGITSFDFSRDWNIIGNTSNVVAIISTRDVATGGLDRELRIWNPYVSTKPIVVFMYNIQL